MSFPPPRINEINWDAGNEDSRKHPGKNTNRPFVSMSSNHIVQGIRNRERNDVLCAHDKNQSWSRVLRPAFSGESRRGDECADECELEDTPTCNGLVS